ncbi:MAG TPA: nitroreductase [Fastidiosipila sp.]|nr:nitroreductase [Fastidiosipila sp.]
MSIINSLKKRRTHYDIKKDLPISQDELVEIVEKVTELVPDSLNMKSARVVLALDEKQDELWDSIYEAFDGQVPREKIDSFKAGHGTILYFYDKDVVENMSDTYPFAKDKFPTWSMQANAMLQLAMWSALKEKNIGASLQHYDPVIDEPVRELFDLPDNWVLNAQMPFGAIGSEPEAKEKEDIKKRVIVKK